MKWIWEYLIVEPFTWIFYCFFQPHRFVRELEAQSLVRIIIPMLRLALPIFLISYPFGIAVRLILLEFAHVPNSNIMNILLVTFLSVAGGITVGIVLGTVRGIRVGIIGGITGSVAFSIIGGSTGSVADGIIGGILLGILLGIAVNIIGDIVVKILGGITFGLVVYIAGGIAVGIIICIKSGITGGITVGTIVGIIVGILICGATTVAVGIIVGIAEGIAVGIVVGIAVGIGGDTLGCIVGGITFIVGYVLGYYRIPLYLASGPSALRTYRASRKNPPQVFTYLHHSSLYWDECVYLHLPYLRHTLLIAAEQNVNMALLELAFIMAMRPQQLSAARAVSLEIAMRDLESRKSLPEITEASQRLAEILPQETRLLDPQWITPFKRLNEASLDAARYLRPIGRQARRKALEDMIANLQNVYPHSAFRDPSLNRRLTKVVEQWLEIARHKLDKIEQAPQDIGLIDNPYNIGNPLQPLDPLFIGRGDLVQQLETALSKGSSRPTFLMNGERRMGKSSTLLQLPHLLGSRYLPIFYNLQTPGIFANTPTFLGTIAESVYNEMHARNMQADKLEYGLVLQQSGVNDAFAYRTFDKWLKSVEVTLEREGRNLLLLFDEFEKLEDAGQGGYLDLILLLDWFRSVIQFHPHVALLFSGVHTFGEMDANTGINWAGFFVNVQTLRVSFLKEQETRKLIIRPVENYPGDEIFAEDIVDEIIRVTGCHPFLVQAICSELIDNLNTEKRVRAELKDVVTAVGQVLENWWDTYFRDLWERTPGEQRKCLFAVRKLGLGDLEEIALQSDLEEKTVRNTLQALLKRDLIVQENGMHRIASPIFEAWVERNG
jgi:uncharacterized protein